MAILKGIAFHFRKREDGLPGRTIPPELYRDSIFQILLTEMGERCMRPDFGCRLKRFLFENVQDPVIKEAIRFEVRSAITRWEPRIELLGVFVEAEEDQPGFVVNIEYRTPDGTDSVTIPYTTPRQQEVTELPEDEGGCP